MRTYHESIDIDGEITKISTTRTTSFGEKADVVGAWNYCLAEKKKGRQFVTTRTCMNRNELGKCLGHNSPDPFL